MANKTHVVTIESESGTVFSFPIKEAEHFSLQWEHSVEGEDWIEVYTLQDGEIVLVSTQFKTFGAGVPHDVGTASSLRDGWVHMTGINRSLGEQLLIRTNPITRHRLIWKGEEYELPIEQESEQYQITIKKQFLF